MRVGLMIMKATIIAIAIIKLNWIMNLTLKMAISIVTKENTPLEKYVEDLLRNSQDISETKCI